MKRNKNDFSFSLSNVFDEETEMFPLMSNEDEEQIEQRKLELREKLIAENGTVNMVQWENAWKGKVFFFERRRLHRGFLFGRTAR